MPTYTRPSDATHKIQLESHLIYAIWSHLRVHAGQEAPLEVRTSLVGNGANITITCKNENGKKFDKAEGMIFNNRFDGTVVIPDNVKPGDMVYFEAELPKHGLMGESNSIPVRPAIQVTSIKWDRQEVKREDVVTMTCQFKSGVQDGDEAMVIVYEHNPNSCDFKVVSIPTTIKDNKIEMQWEFDYQDPTDQIPTDEEMKPYQKTYANPEFYFMVVIDGIRIGEKRESGLLAFVDELTLECLNGSEEITSDLFYTVHMADGGELTGSFGGERTITQSEVRPGPLNIEVEERSAGNDNDIIRSPLNEALDTGECSDSLIEQYKNDNRERE